jgi:hypothetical protein
MATPISGGHDDNEIRRYVLLPQTSLPLLLVFPKPLSLHHFSSPPHCHQLHSFARLQFPNLRNGADDGYRRAPQEWQYGTGGGCRRLPQEWSGWSAPGWGGGAVRAHLAWQQEWLGPVDQAPLTGVRWRYDFFVSSLQAMNTQLRLSVSKLCHPRWRYPYSLFPLLLLMMIRASLINLLFFILYRGFFILFLFFILQYTPNLFSILYPNFVSLVLFSRSRESMRAYE